MTVPHCFRCLVVRLRATRRFAAVSQAVLAAMLFTGAPIGCESRSTVPGDQTETGEPQPAGPHTEKTQAGQSQPGAGDGDLLADGQRSFASAPRPPREVEAGFTPLDLADFVLFAPKSEKGTLDVSESGDVIRLSGDQRAYLHTQKPYRDFTLRLDYRFPEVNAMSEDGNSGVLLFITGENRVWPRCLEVQGKWSEMGHIKSNARDVMVMVQDDQSAREQARRPLGEWNSLEIIARNGAVESVVNGTRIATSEPTVLVEGPIALQAERDAVEFRNVRIQPAQK